jgi:hypothetical protein
MKCGREPGGPNASESGVCPAATQTHLDGINGGIILNLLPYILYNKVTEPPYRQVKVF